MKNIGSDLNWAALVISILKVCTPEDAFEALETGKVKRDVEELLFLKRSYSFDKIAEMYMFPSRHAVYKCITKGVNNAKKTIKTAV